MSKREICPVCGNSMSTSTYNIYTLKGLTEVCLSCYTEFHTKGVIADCKKSREQQALDEAKQAQRHQLEEQRKIIRNEMRRNPHYSATPTANTDLTSGMLLGINLGLLF